MRRFKEKIVDLYVVILMLITIIVPYEVLAGEVKIVIDRSNWQQIQGLVPAQALEWVKRGDYTMKVGTIGFNPALCQPPGLLESLQENIGKYDLDKDNSIVDVNTRKTPRFIKGIPFPKIDPNDPKAAPKVVYNGQYVRSNMGGLRAGGAYRLISRRGHERDLGMMFYSIPLDGWPPAKDFPNPDNIAEYVQIVLTRPYDMAGTAIMNWRYRDAKNDLAWAYLPAARRARRLSPVDRTDALFGCEFTSDDNGYANCDAKVNDYTWKFLGAGEALGGYVNEGNLIRTYQTPQLEWAMDTRGRQTVELAYEKPGWKGFPWAVTSVIYTKRPVFIIEGRPRDPYSNYGKVIHYIDAETFTGYWKVVYDRAGKYFKTMYSSWLYAESDDKKNHFSMILDTFYDERSDHATVLDFHEFRTPEIPYNFIMPGSKTLTIDQFTMSGFTKVCK
jgi:hypothetical protein